MPEQFERYEVLRPVSGTLNGKPHRYTPGSPDNPTTIDLPKSEGDRLVERFVLRATGQKVSDPESQPESQGAKEGKAEKSEKSEKSGKAEEKEESKDQPPPNATSPPKEQGDDSLVNLNTASLDDLANLPNVGRSTAEAIIKARPFKSLEEVPQKAGLTGKPKQNWYEIARLVTV